MFKLLAIRPLTDCASHIHKCLRIGMMYYFCKDFVINESRTHIKRTSKNIKPLKEDFFSLKPLKEDFFSQRPMHPVVNISAIVGMNGDGKSSLIELMMRLVNNCAVDYNLTENKEYPLRRVQGVIAELYYLVDNVLYRMAEEKGDERTRIWKMADLKSQDKYEWEIKEEEVTNINENPACFFFTLVSNYSHYAYNIRDFKQDKTESEKNDSKKCWLHYIFHNNDSYLTPIVIHPYREEGNIDINREYDLSRQRMLSLFLNAPHPKDYPESFRRINHKDAEVLALTEVPYSHLQEKSIVEYFRTVRNETKLDAILNQIKRADNDGKFDELEFKNLIDDVLPNKFETPLINIMTQDKEFIPFVKTVYKWLQQNYNSVFPDSDSSDIQRVIDKLNLLYKQTEKVKYKPEEYRYGMPSGILTRLSTAQLGRLDTIYRIMKCFEVNPFIVGKKIKPKNNTLFPEGNTLSLEDKCILYKVFKILSIINSDPHYKKMAGDGNKENIFREYDNRLEQCIETLKKDVTNNNDSHVTRELLQTEKFIAKIYENGEYNKEIVKTEETPNNDKELAVVSDNKEENNIRLLVNIDKLREKQGGQFKLDELPPPIYNWNILFKREGETTCNIELNSFSSGEKQLLYSLSSIIYHLQNIDKNSIYPNVNLVLEEIELYYHPECQRSLVKRLLELLRGANLQNIKNVNIIFVTHSPFILSDVPKCNVMFLQDGMGIDIMQENTFGANIHSLLKNGFFLPRPMGEFAYQKINTLFARLNSGDFDTTTDLDLQDIYQQILLVGEPFLRNQLLSLYNVFKGH